MSTSSTWRRTARADVTADAASPSESARLPRSISRTRLEFASKNHETNSSSETFVAVAWRFPRGGARRSRWRRATPPFPPGTTRRSGSYPVPRVRSSPPRISRSPRTTPPRTHTFALAENRPDDALGVTSPCHRPHPPPPRVDARAGASPPPPRARARPSKWMTTRHPPKWTTTRHPPSRRPRSPRGFASSRPTRRTTPTFRKEARVCPTRAARWRARFDPSSVEGTPRPNRPRRRRDHTQRPPSAPRERRASTTRRGRRLGTRRRRRARVVVRDERRTHARPSRRPRRHPARGGASAFAPKHTASVSASADAAVSAARTPPPSAELLLRVAALERARDGLGRARGRVPRRRGGCRRARGRAGRSAPRDARRTRARRVFSRRERRDDDDDVRRDVRLRASLVVHAERADALEAEQREIRVTLASVVSAAEALRERADARDDEDKAERAASGAEKPRRTRAATRSTDDSTPTANVASRNRTRSPRRSTPPSRRSRRRRRRRRPRSFDASRRNSPPRRRVRRANDEENDARDCRATEVDSVVGSLDAVVKSLERRAEEIKTDIKTTEQRVSEDRAVIKAAESARVDARNASRRRRTRLKPRRRFAPRSPC